MRETGSENVEESTPGQVPEPKKAGRRIFLKKMTAGAAGLYAASLAKKLEGPFSSPESVALNPQLNHDIKLDPETIEGQIQAEILKTRKLIASENFELLLDQRFLVAALYYSGDFQIEASEKESEVTPARQIIIEIQKMITPETHKRLLKSLDNRARHDLAYEKNTGTVKPLKHVSFGKGHNHRDASDLFTDEGSPVMSMKNGVVVLAEGQWSADNPLSTTSPKGGNNVVVYSPDGQVFARYCHLQEITVKSGDVIRAGQVLGKVGHTGTNASKHGHGKHLHLEINRVNSDFTISALSDIVIRREISKAA